MTTPEDPFDLTTYQWKNRLLLLFAPGRDDAAYLEQRRLLEDCGAELEDRELLIIDVFPDAGRAGRDILPARAAAALRKRFAAREGSFTVLLVGKDGTVKRREETTVVPADLFAQIDGMSMRRRELLERRSKS